eukprot:GILK01010822.1.p1 GENE.GILK01010822.1~~GILK01010822.1.p1  ORF type:complete len:170 (-),score=15.55 GILK01010822.1:441-950(-)
MIQPHIQRTDDAEHSVMFRIDRSPTLLPEVHCSPRAVEVVVLEGPSLVWQNNETRMLKVPKLIVRDGNELKIRYLPTTAADLIGMDPRHPEYNNKVLKARNLLRKVSFEMVARSLCVTSKESAGLLPKQYSQPFKVVSKAVLGEIVEKLYGNEQMTAHDIMSKHLSWLT